MKIHKKKIDPIWFDLRLIGLKDYEIRVNDCDYREGDYMVLMEHEKEHYTGRQMVVKITFVSLGVPYLPNNVVALSTRNARLFERLIVYRELEKRKKKWMQN